MARQPPKPSEDGKPQPLGPGSSIFLVLSCNNERHVVYSGSGQKAREIDLTEEQGEQLQSWVQKGTKEQCLVK